MPKLIDLFESRQDEIYNRFDTDENISPRESDSMNPAFEDQSNPVSKSVLRDIKRMTDFSTSVRGLIFLGKQQLLQSGNTFAVTRLYNPANAIVHAVPFVHKKRHLSLTDNVVNDILGLFRDNAPITFTSLQKETVDKFTQPENLNPAIIRARSKGGILIRPPQEFEVTGTLDRLKNLGIRKIKNTIDQIISPIIRTVSGVQAQLNGGLGDVRPEMSLGTNGKRYYDYVAETYKDIHTTPDNPSPYIQKYIEALANYKGEGGKISIGVSDQPMSSQFSGKLFRNISYESKTRYYKDLQQIESGFNTFIRNDETTTIPSSLDNDSIDVLFSVRNPNTGTKERVRFRAFLSGLKEQVQPSYNENRYVGRYETFYTYNTVLRDVSFSLTIHAFSKEEMDQVIKKMTYLTTLAYPVSSQNYLTPNIFEFTIGTLYRSQPAIMMGVTHVIEDDFSWDIELQKPMTIEANMNIRILDKQVYSYGNLRNREVPFGDANKEYMPAGKELVTERVGTVDVGRPVVSRPPDDENMSDAARRALRESDDFLSGRPSSGG